MKTYGDLIGGELFVCEDSLCVMSEYANSDARLTAYIVGSGECFWGGTSKSEERDKLRVVVVPDTVLERIVTATRVIEEMKPPQTWLERQLAEGPHAWADWNEIEKLSNDELTEALEGRGYDFQMTVEFMQRRTEVLCQKHAEEVAQASGQE